MLDDASHPSPSSEASGSVPAPRPRRAGRFAKSAETIARALALLESGVAGVDVIEALAEEGRPLSLSTLWRSRARRTRALAIAPAPASSPATTGERFPRRRRKTNAADLAAGLRLVVESGLSFEQAAAEMGRRNRPVTWEELFAARVRQRGGRL